MDLRTFYLENISDQEYYYTFYDLIKNINEPEEVFGEILEYHNYKFLLDTEEDIIEKFRNLCLPERENYTSEMECWFYIISFYLNKCGYIIKEFPRVLQHPPATRYDFVNIQIRQKLIEEGRTINSKVPYAERRKLVKELTFEKKDFHVELTDAMEKNFKKISNRDASFASMSIDERLAEIANLTEYKLKRNGKFVTLDYSQICFDFINDKMVTDLRKKLQCYRHSSQETLKEREQYTEEQKSFFIDYGLTVLKAISILITKENDEC